MEVLGAVASSLALLEISLKTASFLQGISEIQSDYEDLKLEITNIDAIIKDFQHVPRLVPNRPGLPQVSEPLSMALADRQLRDIRNELDEIATHCAQIPDDKRSRAKKVKWILKRNKIAKLHQKARDAKSNLQVAMNCQAASLTAMQIIAGHKSHSEVIAVMQSLRHIQYISSSQVPPHTIEDVTDPPIEEVQTTDDKTRIRITCEVDSKDVVVRQSTRHDSSEEPVDNGPSLAPREKTGVRVSTFQLRAQAVCFQGCRCRCHFLQSCYRGPAWVQPLLGSWVLDYTPKSGEAKSLCSDPACVCEGASLVNLQYRLPQWLWARTLLFKAACSSSGLSFALRPARVLGAGDGVWRWIEGSSKSFHDPGMDTLMYFPDDEDKGGLGLIFYAVDLDRFDVVELLLKQWANLLPKQGFPRKIGYVVNEYLRFYGTEDTSRRVDLLRQVMSFVDYMPEWQSTRVRKAALRGHGMKEALREEAWAMNELDHTGRAPLHTASQWGHVEAVEELIRAKADVNKPDFRGCTPLSFAAVDNQVECMRLLLKAGCSVHQQDDSGNCAIHWAAECCCTEAVALLLAAGASASARGWWGRTPLHLVAQCDTNTNPDAIKETILLLLVAKDVGLEARDDDGSTPVMRAVVKNNLPALRCLIQTGASMHTIDAVSRNMLHLAALNGNAQVLQYLLSLETKVFSGINTELRDHDDDTPWDEFLWTTQTSLLQLSGFNSPSPAEQDAFARLYQAVRDKNINLEIRLLNRTIEFLHQNHARDARAQLAILIDQKKDWKQFNLVGWYRGIDQRIQQGDVESVIEILTEDIEHWTAGIGASPWGIENRWGIKGPVVSSLSSGSGDDPEEGELLNLFKRRHCGFIF